MKVKYCLLVLLWPVVNGFTQSSTLIRPLKIGDTVPDIKLSNITNSSFPETSLSSFSEKSILFDFFATWCAPCIEKLPLLDSLQKLHTAELQIFIVSSESTQAIWNLRKRNKRFASVQLPIITSDSLLSKYFPHKLIPHTVWINKARQVKAITQGHYVTVNNVVAFLKNYTIDLPLKTDILDFDQSRPILENNNGGTDASVITRSLLSRHLEGLYSGGGKRLNADSSIKTIFYLNNSIPDLYLSATGFWGFQNRVLLETDKTENFIRPADTPWDQWDIANTYCYELTYPASIPDERAKQLILDDLNSRLDINGRIELRKMKCWVLTSLQKDDKLFRTRGGKSENSLSETNNRLKAISNMPLSVLVGVLNKQVIGSPIVIDETGYNGNVDLCFEITDIHNLPLLSKSLKRYGLSLTPVERKLKMLVLTQKKID